MTISPSSTSTSTATAACAAVFRGTRFAHRAPVVRPRRSARTPAAVFVPVEHHGCPTSTRITRRGRLVLTLALVGLLLAAFSLGRADAPQAATEAAPAPAVVQTTVQAGDSLWTVAQRVAPESDPREVVQQLRTLNELSGSGLQVGQQLLLPA